MANSSISGIISGLDTDSIISQLTSLRRAPQIRMQARKTALQKKLEAWDGLKQQLSSLKSAAAALSQAATFRRSTATSSDTALVTVAASPEAAPGTYHLTVLATAQAHQVKSQGYADTGAAVLGTGTITIQVGSGTPGTIVIDETNNSLAGLRDAINRAGLGVTASIVNDGDATHPYRLVVTSDTTGETNQITITADLTGGTAPTFTTLQEARNASIRLGEGAGAMLVSKPSNNVTDVIPGVTLNLVSADENKRVMVNVARDTNSIGAAVQELVNSYNALVDNINSQGKYDPETQQGGTLLGDASLLLIQDEIQRVLDQVMPGVAQGMNTISNVGLTVGSDGKLQYDSARLTSALKENPTAVMRLFANYGETADPRVKYIGCTTETVASGAAGYSVHITQVATRSRITAGVAQTEALAGDEQLTINGTTILLTSGMTQADVIAAINAKSSLTGVIARATGADGTGEGNYLTLEASQYGSAYTLSVVSNMSNGGAMPVGNRTGIGSMLVTESDAAGEAGTGSGARGVNVAGTINGEPATGSGQILTGKVGNATTSGLMLQITSQTTGAHGSVVFTRGVGGELERIIQAAIEGAESTVEQARSSVQAEIDALTEEMKLADERLAALQERLRAQFTAMESTLSRLQNQSLQLAQQIASLSGQKSSTRGM
ncbi:MAG TPA: flagellar filament capping protein FliD [Armatimonadota bacterium]|nr:flagellar filament capping protein FliD [Armatimonadota bacterium]HOM82034.1 flagellar filament capping protein FliD [Armatimonadota bacterium]HPO73077.1 flagellar filament capping protein FliD [Armatimonadota bacterium]HPT98342.1 flagellar filament capping protein FliD [Armatimonadota bacterium]